MTFEPSTLQRVATSVVGALVFATIFVTAAVGPAQAAVLNAPLF